MKEIFQQTKIFWDNYWGKSLVMWLLVFSVLYLLIFRRHKKSTKYLIPYTAVVLILFFCPISAKFIQKCIGKTVYWRVLWLLPAIPAIAAAMTEFLKERKNKGIQFGLVLLAIAAIAYSGRGIYAAGNYKLVNNYQQVPDEVAAICEMVKKDAGDSEFILAADNYIGPYVRVYDPSICMMFNREGRGNAGAGARRLYLEINAPVFNYTNIGAVGKRILCNYLVVKIPNEQQKKELENQGYQEVGTAGNYSLYRLGVSADAVRSPLLDRWEWGVK